MKENAPEIVLVDDDKPDVELFTLALKDTSSYLRLTVARNGEELISMLNARTPESLPSVIFLDLNMPVKDGRETLIYLKNSAVYRKIPVFIYTTSNSEDDVNFCYANGANLYLNKPYGYDQLVTGLRSVCELIPDFLLLP